MNEKNLPLDPPIQARRDFFRRSVLGAAALSTLGNHGYSGASRRKGEVGGPHFTPKAQRVIYLFQSGGPSQLELMDYKPALTKLHGSELPDSIRQGQRLTGMTSGQKSFPVVAPNSSFRNMEKAEHGSASCCRARPISRTTCALFDPCTPRRSTTTQRLPLCKPGRSNRVARRWGPG